MPSWHCHGLTQNLTRTGNQVQTLINPSTEPNGIKVKSTCIVHVLLERLSDSLLERLSEVSESE